MELDRHQPYSGLRPDTGYDDYAGRVPGLPVVSPAGHAHRAGVPGAAPADADVRGGGAAAVRLDAWLGPREGPQASLCVEEDLMGLHALADAASQMKSQPTPATRAPQPPASALPQQPQQSRITYHHYMDLRNEEQRLQQPHPVDSQAAWSASGLLRERVQPMTSTEYNAALEEGYKVAAKHNWKDETNQPSHMQRPDLSAITHRQHRLRDHQAAMLAQQSDPAPVVVPICRPPLPPDPQQLVNHAFPPGLLLDLQHLHQHQPPFKARQVRPGAAAAGDFVPPVPVHSSVVMQQAAARGRAPATGSMLQTSAAVTNPTSANAFMQVRVVAAAKFDGPRAHCEDSCIY